MYKKLTQKEYQYMKQILILKQKLSKTDYLAIKYAENELTLEEYQSIKDERKAWRKEINELEEKLRVLRLEE